MSLKGDFKKVRREAEANGARVVEGKETWLFYPPMPEGVDRTDLRYQPCKIGHTPSGRRTWVNFLKCLERKGLR
jgi:hypothetical protein